MKRTVFFLFIVTGIAGTISFTNKEKSPSASRVNKEVNEKFGFVRSGLVQLENDTFSVQAFLMSKTEVTNGEYQIFLNELLQSGKTDLYAIAKIDSANWSALGWDNEGYRQFYHNHPVYKDYPVVNVSKEGARMYCEWLTEKYNQLLPEGQQLKFRLPLKSEWIRAACGDDFEAVYTWKNSFLRNNSGHFLANFVHVGEGAIKRDESGNFVVMPVYHDYIDIKRETEIIAPSKSYWPNEFGIYQMNGNVAELLDDTDEVIGGSWYDTGYDIRNRSVQKYKGSSTKVGFRVVSIVKTSELTWFKPKN